MSPGGKLKAAIAAGKFFVTAEITPRLTTNADELLHQAEPLRDRVVAVNVTDGAGARVTMSSLAASALLQQNGIEPILQMTCRDRNRIAISADLIGAAAFGIENVLVLTGDNPGAGDEPEAKGVFDFQASDIMALARRMSEQGEIGSGRKLSYRPSFIVGGVDAPFDPPADWRPDKLTARADLGMQFIQTQFCYDPAVTARYVARLEQYGLLERVALIIGVGPIASLRSAQWMHENLFGVSIPDAVMQRLQAADDEAAEGHRICVELINTYRNMSGVAGVHIMAPAQSSERIADVIDAAFAA
ncbi:MAG: methylenetetrahydrofolate reductase [Gammaproteobacteria bacterium]|nr:methylenetetrahydrofolate reductase [Gammaproteobacteria bacterium]MDH5302477.1 methylenetetrahydrofolate reductase [Gammaproteobacteria bacterium]MDH5321359.1 methylenetetrahydrofolate reductase [Gammaproteobacteria bacterium]